MLCLFGKPICYPAILVTYFRTSFTKFINYKVYGVYIFLHLNEIIKGQILYNY